MITLHNVADAGKALQYFAKDNYYTEHEGLEESQWFGRAAAELGLAGKIDKQAFRELLNGVVDQHDLGRYARNEETGEIERVHRPATDMTFSAPKSVSLLAEVHGVAAVREAHEASVQAALAYVERELSTTRQMENGELREVQTGKLAIAMFRHNTSRDLDPQTHTHAVIINATQRPDGQWRSLANDGLYQQQRLVNAIYMGELAGRLQQLGYGLDRTDEKGNFEVSGFSREQLEAFSLRRQEIAAALKERGIDINEASAQQKEDAALATRARKTKTGHQELQGEWRQRAAGVGIEFAAISEQAAARQAQPDIARSDRLSGRQALEFAAAHLIEREAVVAQDDLLRTAVEHGYGRVLPGEVLNAYQELVAQGRLVELGEGKVTTAKMLDSERWTLEQVRASQRQANRILGQSAILERLERIEARQQMIFSTGQREAIVMTLSSHDRFVAVQGLSGTGKTTLLRGMREIAEEAGYRVRGMAPTGNAAKVMASEAGIASDTVAMFMIKERQLQKDIAFAQQFADGFQRQKELWIVDESSFLSQRQQAQLENMAIRAGAKVVFQGDKFQLQGVEAGKPFDMGQRHGMETATMDEVNRQRTEALVGMVNALTGKDTKHDGQPLTRLESLHNARAFEYIDRAGLVRELPADKVLATLAEDFVALPPAERARTMVITAYNADRKEINQLVRIGLQERGELAAEEQQQAIYVSKGWTRAVIKEAQYYQAGDVVRFGRAYKALAADKGQYMTVASVMRQQGVVLLRRGDGSTVEWQPKKQAQVEVYDAERRKLAVGDLIRMTRAGEPLKNGEVAQVASIDNGIARLALEQGGNTVAFSLQDNRHWDHAYARTVHSAQGSTRHRTLFHIPSPVAETEAAQHRAVERMAKVFGDRSFYVGATRASHELVLYTSNKQTALEVITGRQDKTSAVEALEVQDRVRQGGRDQQLVH